MQKKSFDIDAFKTQRLPTESEIMASWHGDIEKPIVSVICITFNQEIYIEDTITGFLIQETGFAFEIIIHDDASTDKTADIIRKYQSIYPNLIKPIFQKENQFSKGGFRPNVYAAGFSNGEFLALCEGDDYWVCKDKLKLQVNELTLDKSINLCFHSSLRLSGDKISSGLQYTGGSKITCAELILSDFHLCATASMMFRKSVFVDLTFLDGMSIGDFYLRIFAAQKNGAVYLNKQMCVYRVNSQGSWSERNNKSIKKETNFIISFYNELKIFDCYLNSKYHKEFTILRLRLLSGFIRKANVPVCYRSEVYHLDEKIPTRVKLLWHLVYSRKYYNRIYFLGHYIKYLLKK